MASFVIDCGHPSDSQNRTRPRYSSPNHRSCTPSGPSEVTGLECPTLVLWSKDSGLDTWYAEAGGPLAIWRRWAGNVSGKAIAGGHFFPEQNVEDTLAELLAFIA